MLYILQWPWRKAHFWICQSDEQTVLLLEILDQVLILLSSWCLEYDDGYTDVKEMVFDILPSLKEGDSYCIQLDS